MWLLIFTLWHKKDDKRIRNICKIIRQDVNVSSYEKRSQTKKIRIKEVEGPNQREEVKEIHLTPSLIEMMIKDQINDNGRSCETKKKLKQVSFANETKINKVKLNVLPINNIQRNISCEIIKLIAFIKNNHNNSSEW